MSDYALSWERDLASLGPDGRDLTTLAGSVAGTRGRSLSSTRTPTSAANALHAMPVIATMTGNFTRP